MNIKLRYDEDGRLLMTVLSLNDFPIGVYASEEECKEAIAKIREDIKEGCCCLQVPDHIKEGRCCLQVPDYIKEAEESGIEVYIRQRFHLHFRTFPVNEANPCGSGDERPLCR